MSKPNPTINRECSLLRASGAPMGAATIKSFKPIKKPKPKHTYRRNAPSWVHLEIPSMEATFIISGKDCDCSPIEEAFNANEVITIKFLEVELLAIINILTVLSVDSYNAELTVTN